MLLTLVEGVEHGRVDPGSPAGAEPVPPGDGAAAELLLARHETFEASPTHRPDAPRGGIGAAAPENVHVARKVDKRLVICSLLIAVGLVIVVLGVLRGVTGTAAANLPKSIEELIPSVGATNVPNQTSIFVDLEAGYTGELIVDGVLLPTISEDQVRDVAPGEQAKPALGTVYAEGNATLTFQPIKGAPIESLDEGLHEVVVRYWPVTNPNAIRQFPWQFTVV